MLWIDWKFVMCRRWENSWTAFVSGSDHGAGPRYVSFPGSVLAPLPPQNAP
jgi:hypothetical protein